MINHKQVRLVAEVAHMVSDRTYIALDMVIFLACATLLNIYVSFSAAAAIGLFTAIIVLISLLG